MSTTSAAAQPGSPATAPAPSPGREGGLLQLALQALVDAGDQLSLLARAGDVLARIGPDGTVRRVSDGVADVLGVTPSDLVGDHVATPTTATGWTSPG